MDPDKPNKCKVGVTKNETQRIKAYKTAAPNCYFLKVYENVDKKHEKRILEELRGVAKVQSEYVHCSPQFVQNVVESYFTDNNVEF